jgi:lambda family phage tail tape measure protein
MSQDYKVDLHLNTRPAKAAIDALNAKIAKLQKAALGDLGTASGKKSMDQTSKAANKLSNELAQLKRDMKALGKIPIAGNTSRQLNQIDASASRLNATLLKLRLNGQISEKTYTRMADSLQKTSTQLRRVKLDADFGYSSLRKFWERFGKVALGFSVMYTGMRLISTGFMAFSRVMQEGIQQAGEMASIQAKLAMWYTLSTDSVESYGDAFTSARENVKKLADVSVTSLSSLSELGTALDEIGQSSVGLGVESLEQFASLVDFTVLIAKTTDSTLKQVRQELQALMQGQMRPTNILIRTAVHMNMITNEQLTALRKQEGRLEVIKSIMGSIHNVWQKVKQEMVMADVNTGMKMWYDTLVRIISKSEELASKDSGVQSIFGATAYKHFKRMEDALDSMTGKFNGAMKGLNAGFDSVLTLIEDTIKGTLKLADALYKIRGMLSFTAKVGGGALAVKGAASLAGVSGPVGWIAAGVLAADQFIKKLADMESSPLWALMKDAGKGLVEIWEISTGMRKPAIMGLGLTAKGASEMGNVKEVEASLAEVRAKIKDHYDKLQKLQQSRKQSGKYGYIFDDKIAKEQETLVDLQVLLDKLKDRFTNLTDPASNSAKALKEFFKETNNIKSSLKDLNFDPISGLFKYIEQGSFAGVQRLQDVARSTTLDQIALVKSQLSALKSGPESEEKSLLETGLNERLLAHEQTLNRINNATKETAENYKKQLDPLSDLRQENEELAATLNGTLDAYKKNLLIEETLADIRKNTGKEITASMREAIVATVEQNMHLTKQVDMIGKQSEAEKEAAKARKIQVRIIQERLEAMREERKLALDNWKVHNEFRQKQIDDERSAVNTMQQTIYEYYTTETEREYNEFLKRASNYEAYIEGNKELTDEFYKWRADMAERYEKPWLAGLKDGLKKASDNIGWTFENVSDTVQAAFSNMTDTLTDFVMTGKASFSDFAESIIRDMLRMQIQASITQPLASGLGDLFGSFGQSMANAWYGNVSAVGAAGPMPQANGGVFQSPSLHAYANTVQTSPKLFTFAQGGVFAEAGPEAVMPLTRGANGRLGVESTGGNISIVVNNNAPETKANAQVSEDPQGGKRIDIIIDEINAKNIKRAGSGTARAMKSQYSVSPKLLRR